MMISISPSCKSLDGRFKMILYSVEMNVIGMHAMYMTIGVCN